MILDKLNNLIKENSGEVSAWINSHLDKILIPLYTSVDIRYSEFKVVPVDTNVFPAGFNNLTPQFQETAGKLFKDSINSSYPSAKNILLVPELNTRNSYYWENIYVIKSILKKVGFNVRVGIVQDDFEHESMVFNSASGKKIEGYKVRQNGTEVFINDFRPDLLLINNDFSEKCPNLIRDIKQPVLPPIEIGWHTRRKDIHFEFYNKLAGELAKIIEIDPWIISIETRFLQNIDFDDGDDREKAASSVSDLIDQLKKHHLEKKVDYDPSVFIKSNSGTYGMAVVNVLNSDDVLNFNSQNRKKMRVSKGGIAVRDVVIQEGIPSALKLNGNITAEPVIYLVDAKVAGMFYRANRSRNENQNLNSRGMEFVMYDHDEDNGIPSIFGLLSKVATIAAGYEIEKIIKDGGCMEDD